MILWPQYLPSALRSEQFTLVLVVKDIPHESLQALLSISAKLKLQLVRSFIP